ncbi:MAG: glycoside hydrolase family 43 protein [Anaerolineae bacterium]|jgi:xylan 1,4-beta-xylosidase|nr:glycoside hydrolase family 43 protein [Chloroflexota bacterium]
MLYRNPVIPGFYPDPSICRAGEDYYLVTSSFEYFPGVPVFHSRDLVDWELVGHCLSRPEQLPLQGARASGGIFAPTIRYHQGRFYMVTTNVTGGGHFYVSTDDPAGQWSDPIWVKTEGFGIDPSLLFDDDGTCYFTSTGRGGLTQFPIDIATGRALGPERQVWQGSGGSFPEAPHLYKINGLYYQMLAEGGTERGHMVTMARSETPWGPWEPCPHNPILSHRSRGRSIQSTGHADLIEAHDGSWWLVFLATRPYGPYPLFHNLGRETNIAPVVWVDGWPVVGSGGLAEAEAEAPAFATAVRQRWDEPTLDRFAEGPLPLYWNWLRNPHPEDYSLSERPGWLRLRGSAVTLNALDSPAWLGRRQQHQEMSASVTLEFVPEREGDEAGLSVLMNNRHHYEVFVTLRAGVRVAQARRTIGSMVVTSELVALPDGPVTLCIEAESPASMGPGGHGEGEPVYRLGVQTEGGLRVLDTPEMRYIATEVAGGFTGAYLGMYATGNGAVCAQPADFTSFSYARRAGGSSDGSAN